MDIVIDGITTSGKSRGKSPKAVPAEVERLALVVIGHANGSTAVKNGSTLYRNEDGTAKRLDAKEAQKLYSYVYNLSRKNETFSHLAPHIFKTANTNECYVYFTDKNVASV